MKGSHALSSSRQARGHEEVRRGAEVCRVYPSPKAVPLPPEEQGTGKRAKRSRAQSSGVKREVKEEKRKKKTAVTATHRIPAHWWRER